MKLMVCVYELFIVHETDIYIYIYTYILYIYIIQETTFTRITLVLARNVRHHEEGRVK